jgi:hypothetical protein
MPVSIAPDGLSTAARADLLAGSIPVVDLSPPAST